MESQEPFFPLKDYCVLSMLRSVRKRKVLLWLIMVKLALYSGLNPDFNELNELSRIGFLICRISNFFQNCDTSALTSIDDETLSSNHIRVLARKEAHTASYIFRSLK